MSAPAILYHFAFHPASRTARLALGEAKIEWAEEPVRPWDENCPLFELNASGMPPVLAVTERGKPLNLCELDAILGWIEDRAKGDVLLPSDVFERAEARRLTTWFTRRFSDDVDSILLHERVEKPLLRLGPPDARQLREGREALKQHLFMLEELASTREWLAGRRLSQADLVAAGHISALDYFGEMPWGVIPSLKLWYSKIKSRPCFRALLSDRLPGVSPASWYTDLDF